MTQSRVKHEGDLGKLLYCVTLFAVAGGLTYVCVWRPWKDKVGDDTHSLYCALFFLGSLCVISFLHKLVMNLLGLRRDRNFIISKVAETMGFNYAEKLSGSQVNRFDSLPLFQTIPGESGVTRKVTNVITGTRAGLSMMVADYAIDNAKGVPRPSLTRLGSASSHDQHMALMPGYPTIVIFPSGEGVKGPPDFFLDPETLDNKPLWKGLGNIIGWEDVDFEGTDTREKFSKRYRLRGNKEETLRNFFNDQRIGFFADHPGWSVQGSPDNVAIWRGRSLVRTDTIGDLCDEAAVIYRVLIE